MKKQINHIFGIRAITEAIKAGKDIDKVLIKKGLQGPLFQEFFNLIRDYQIAFQFVPKIKLDKITRKNHQGVIAFISPIHFQNIEHLLPMLFELRKDPFLLVLDGVTDVRNLGSIARTAECMGVHALIIPVKGGAQINADAVKTSAGALLNIPVCRSPHMVKTMEFLKESGLQIVSITEKAKKYVQNADYNIPMALVMGGEETGISQDILKISDDNVKIPMHGKTESLNVSNAASIVLYEAVRQKME